MSTPTDDTILVTTLQVRRWAVTQGLHKDGAPGVLPNRVIEAYEAEHPNHLHSRYAHGPGGYDKGCRCDECTAAHGYNPNPCAVCRRRKASVTVAQGEVARIARAMSQNSRNETRLRPALEAAKRGLDNAKQIQADHAREHEEDA